MIKLVRKIYSSKPLSDFCEEETIPGKQISTGDQYRLWEIWLNYLHQ